ncbi:hypothetical protein F4778DRAFT_733383 [Xylariomycetidae sp. FL2044]|nr:hypothetical protein F4778DRAFT_733383 [Xylariomycetidae sp. FL2044]
MRFTPFAIMLTALALGASATPAPEPSESLSPLNRKVDCDCSQKSSDGTCTVTKTGNDDKKWDIKLQCGKKCTASVGGKDVEFKYYSSVPKGSSLAKEVGLDPWVCHSGLNKAACGFYWEGATAEIYCATK